MRVRRLVRRLILPLLVVVLMAQAASPASADDPREELEKAQNKLEFIRQQKELTKNLLADAYWRSEEARLQLTDAEASLAVATSQLAVISNQVVFAEEDLKKVEADLAAAQKRFAANKERLARRVRAISEDGRVNYLAVLFGSSSFMDFIGRFDALKMVIRKDAELFAQVRKDTKALEDRQAEALSRRARLTELKAQAVTRRANIIVKRDEKAEATVNLEQSKKSLQARLAEFDREEEKIQELVVEVQKRLARQGGKFQPVFPVARPVNVTDSFGPRLHPILGVWRPHNGTDFAASYGAPVYAIEEGLVIIANWNDAYGWLIVLDHGSGISSWYGHSSKLLVKEGEQVRQGQRIANAGSTGWSTGPHVHLEIRINGNPEDAMKYLK